MKTKYIFLAMLTCVAIVTIAHAARTQRNLTIIDETIVSPLDGYAGQISGDDYMGTTAALLVPASESLLDEPAD